MMYSDLQTRFYEILGDSSTAPAYITTATAMAFANMAVRKAANVAEHLEKRGYILCAANTAEYDLAADCKKVFRVTYDDDVILPVMQIDLRLEDESWDQHAGTPRNYYLDELNRKIGLHWKPSVATTYDAFSGEYGVIVDTDDSDDTFTQEVGIVVDVSDASSTFSQEDGEIVQAVSAYALDVFYVAEPGEITAGDDYPNVPEWAAPFVLFYMLGKALSADTEIRDLDSSRFYFGLADMVLARMRLRSGNRMWRDWNARSDRFGKRKRWPITWPDTIASS